MSGYAFTKYIPKPNLAGQFQQLLDLFKEILVYTSGDVAEALNWLTQLDQHYQITTDQYGIGDFISELEEKGFLQKNSAEGSLSITPKMEQGIRQSSLEQVFGKLKKSRKGSHLSHINGNGDEMDASTKSFQFGDDIHQIAMSESIRNAHIHHGIHDFRMEDTDLEILETTSGFQSSTVLMIDISHSMILYGEDRITPAKKVAMALAELIQKKYPKDTLDIIVFGNDAWQIQVKDLPYLQVGPYHTNTVAGLQLAMELLRRRKNANKNIFMITDGKPTCIKENGFYYKNSFGLDRKILNKTYQLSAQCKKMNIHITTFMIAKDPYLQDFVEAFTQINQGKAFYTSLKGLGEYVFADYARNKKRTVR
ncbi:MAG: VWA domain-containing protein [Chitinophagales bacterium]|nr:VWA domain-containing protein [Chitinophagales bacterium]